MRRCAGTKARGLVMLAGSAFGLSRRGRRVSTRGIVSVLSMMFLILFGSLAVAMAISSQGNMRTASTHLRVMGAMSAAETGLKLGAARLAYATSRIRLDKSTITSSIGAAVWSGSPTSVGTVSFQPIYDGTVPTNIADALAYMHGLDENILPVGGITAPALGSAPAGLVAGTYATSDWLVTPCISLDANDLNGAIPTTGSGFQITYAPLANTTTIRIIATGYDFGETRNGVPVSRTMMQDFSITKRVESALISPARVMLGKNAIVDGDIGVTFDQVTNNNGNPLVVRSDFAGLNGALDTQLGWLDESLVDHDVDGDNRLRTEHPEESLGAGIDIDGDGVIDEYLLDLSGDGFIDEFDLFLAAFDTNDDGKVALADHLRAGTANAGLTAEFVTGTGASIDEDLAILLDTAKPDRNGNGLTGWLDLNGNGLWDPATEELFDKDPVSNVFRDHALGWRDGVIDYRDMYAKVRGELKFRVTASDWVASQGSISQHVQGPIVPGKDKSAMAFGLNDTKLTELQASDFNSSKSELVAANSNGAGFWDQVASNLGVAATALPTYVETKPPGTPRYFRLDPDANGDGMPDNAASAYFEKMPFNSPSFSDWYYRPVFENMVFRDAQLPVGLNALFVNCAFVGATYVRTTTDNTHPVWNLHGRMSMDAGTGRPAVPVRQIMTDPAQLPDDILPSTALPNYQPFSVPVDNINNALDKADFAKNARPSNWADLPDPLVIGGKRVINTKDYSNNIRFHDCMVIGSIVSDSATDYTHPRNKMQFTGGTKFVDKHPDPALASNPIYVPDTGDLAALAKSSLMLPNYSVDIGAFNSPPSQDVRLKGAIIAGVLDVRGNASLDGALLLTYKPVLGQGPLKDPQGNPIGNPAGFNATFGYFGPDDGDLESIDPNDLTIYNGQRITGWDTNGDGLADLPHDTPLASVPAGATAVPFHGYGRIQLRFDPNMPLPDGILMPLSIRSSPGTYQEGRVK